MGTTSVTSAAGAGASRSELRMMAKLRQRKAAEIVALAAKFIARDFSTRIPASIRVRGYSVVSAGGPKAPNAYPFETGASHPLFGDTAHWYKQPKKQFLEEAAEAASGAAAEEFALVFDDWAEVLQL